MCRLGGFGPAATAAKTLSNVSLSKKKKKKMERELALSAGVTDSSADVAGRLFVT